jgi:hypothetical protein
MRKFFHCIDKRSRAAMIGYLTGHFRYSTMNHWNRSTSYACNLKIHTLGLDRDIEEKLFRLLGAEGAFDSLNSLMREFGEAYDYRWQAGMNGRSGGYLVLYQGCVEPSGYKSCCASCGQRNYRSVAESGNICGVCREPARHDFPETHMSVRTYVGRGTDGCEDFEDWALYNIKARVKLVQSFDKLADAIVSEAVRMAKNCEIREETYMVKKTRLVPEPVRQEAVR